MRNDRLPEINNRNSGKKNKSGNRSSKKKQEFNNNDDEVKSLNSRRDKDLESIKAKILKDCTTIVDQKQIKLSQKDIKKLSFFNLFKNILILNHFTTAPHFHCSNFYTTKLQILFNFCHVTIHLGCTMVALFEFGKFIINFL
jgi:hypothetical protein